MSDPLLCPLKFNNPRLDPHDDWQCEGESCAWWTKGKERCSMSSIAMGSWAILDAIRDTIEAKPAAN